MALSPITNSSCLSVFNSVSTDLISANSAESSCTSTRNWKYLALTPYSLCSCPPFITGSPGNNEEESIVFAAKTFTFTSPVAATVHNGLTSVILPTSLISDLKIIGSPEVSVYNEPVPVSQSVRSPQESEEASPTTYPSTT